MVTTAVPSDIEAEEGLLGAMLLSGDAAAKAIDLAQSADFYRPAHGHLFAAMDSLHRRGEAIDAVTVMDELTRFGLADTIEPSIFVSLQANTPSIANAMQYAEIVVRHASARRVLAITQEATQRLYAYADPYDLVDELQGELKSVDLPASIEHQRARTLDEIVIDAQHESSSPWVVPGVVRSDWRVVVVGEEGSGKSVMLKQVAACTAQGVHPFRLREIAPARVLLVDLENPVAAIAETGETLVTLLRRKRGEHYRPDNLRIYERPAGVDLRGRHDRMELEREIQIQKPALVCIGPAYKMLNRRDGESHEEATEPVLRILDDMRTRHGFALIIEHHAPQGATGARRTLRPYGSQRWLAWPEMGITMRCEENEPWRYTLGRFRGDRLKADWPTELERSDRRPPSTAAPWPWIGRFETAQPSLEEPF